MGAGARAGMAPLGSARSASGIGRWVNAAGQFAPATKAAMLGMFAVPVAAALVVLVATRGRLGWTPEPDAEAAAAR